MVGDLLEQLVRRRDPQVILCELPELLERLPHHSAPLLSAQIAVIVSTNASFDQWLRITNTPSSSSGESMRPGS